MIGVLIPAHNEEQLIGNCLEAVLIASQHPLLAQEPVAIMAVLDSCTDQTLHIARQHQIDVIELNVRNVGVARATGAALLLEQGARWIACTDADSLVAPDWLVEQLALNADAVCGTVTPGDWPADIPQHAQIRYEQHYKAQDGHRHVHGANLGISAVAYQRAGGFPPLACDEDVQLVHQLQQDGAHIAWSCRPRVITSMRLDSRADSGFGDFLKGLMA
jgi:glycosyltransferase involved in cell wall biosynthesis